MSDPPQASEPPTSYQAMLQVSPAATRKTELKRSSHEPQASIDSGWDVVDDLPLRWATDYVPLAVPGSRLMNASVLTYALWRNDDQPRGSALLAVAVKSAVLLYESPKGERAFRFIKVSPSKDLITCMASTMNIFSPTPRNSTLRWLRAASHLSTSACKTTFLGAFQTPQASGDSRRNSTGEDEDRGTACASARRHSRRRC